MNENDLSGRLGIKNLGNTCYLNSALQCLCHIEDIVSYIKHGDFKADLELNKKNFDNASHNEYFSFADSFSDFITNVWNPTKDLNEQKFIIPTDLRRSLIQLYPEFDNANQQDAHEVLTLILDILSSALNRIIPHNHLMVSDNKPGILNDSFIIDTFFGKMKSAIHCRNCGIVLAENFDPFSSLELPTPNEYKVFLYFIPTKKNIKTFPLFVTINDNFQFKHIIEKVKTMIDYKFNNGIFYYVFDNKLEKIIDNDERCGDLMQRMSFLFLMEKSDFEKTKFYIELNIKIIGEDKNASFPRVFSYNSSKSNSIWIYQSIFSELNGYLQQFKKEQSDKSKFSTDYFTIKSNFINNKNSCIICKKESDTEFECKCINELLTKEKDFRLNSQMENFIRDLTETFILSVTYYVERENLKVKDLNKRNNFADKIVSEKELDIYDLCDYFFAEEKIDGKYDCNKCGEIKSYIKKQEVFLFPKVLILHLKRFKYGKDEKSVLNVGEKNEVCINFTTKLDLSKYSAGGEEGNYELIGVIYHRGKISSGHYTSICKHSKLKQWFVFDDKAVKMLDKKSNDDNFELPKEDGYILFYEKV